MTKHFPSIVSALCITTFPLIWTPAAQAKQCTAVAPPNMHSYWSWRLIDGRKCWYEGKPMLSKSLLEWPSQASARPAAGKELASAAKPKSGDPMDSQAWAPAASDNTFEALWRSRIEQH
jgi:hypothetical protein